MIERGRLPPLLPPPLRLKALQPSTTKGTLRFRVFALSSRFPYSYITSNDNPQTRPFIRDLLQQLVAHGLVTGEIAVQVDPLFSSGSTEGGGSNQKWYAEAVGPDGSVDLAVRSFDFLWIFIHSLFVL